MLVKSDSPQPPGSNIARIARAFRRFGRIGVILQVIFAFVAVISLLFAVSGRNFSSDSNSANSIGIFWAICALVSLGLGLVLTFRYTLVGRSLQRHTQVDYHPKKSDAIRLLRAGVVTATAGILLALFGAGTSAGVMIAKTISQPPGVAITDPNKIVRALDVLILIANLNLITAHFVGLMVPLWLLDRIHYYEKVTG